MRVEASEMRLPASSHSEVWIPKTYYKTERQKRIIGVEHYAKRVCRLQPAIKVGGKTRIGQGQGLAG